MSFKLYYRTYKSAADSKLLHWIEIQKLKFSFLAFIHLAVIITEFNILMLKCEGGTLFHILM